MLKALDAAKYLLSLVNQDNGDTISNLITELDQMGIYANLDESTGILEITGGEFRTMTNAKDENGKAYAYCDAAGNYYEMNFGLSY